MERLTKRLEDGQAVMDCDLCRANWAKSQEDECTALYCRNRLKDRLAAYEDTGLEPEEIIEAENRHHDCKIDCLLQKYNELADAVNDLGGLDHLRELVQAEKAGRLVVLPCKTVYVPTWDAGEQCDLACHVSIGGEGCCDLCDKAEQFIYEEPCRQEHIEQIGKTVFLTREEAEAAMKGGEG